MKKLLSLILALVLLVGLMPVTVFAAGDEGDAVADEITYASETLDIDLFIFAGQSNMMGASVLEPEVDTFTEKSFEYKYVPRLRGEATGSFVSAQNPAGEFYYNDLTTAYGDMLNDLSYKSTLSNYSVNTYFCPAMRDGVKGFSAQSEADTYPSASLAPYFVTEYAEYGHASVYAHTAKGSAKIVHYFTEEMVTRYNTLITEYNNENGKSYSTLSADSLSGAGDAFDDKYNAMVEDYATFAPGNTVKNKCFVWLQGESDGSNYTEYKLKLQVLWEHLQELGFTHFFVLRVGYWGNAGILNVIKAQEDFCAENENCYIVTRAPSLIPHPSATTDNWWLNEPSAEYANCRDSYLVNSGNKHFNEKAMQIFAERSAANVHRILHQGLAPVLEEENIRGMIEEKPEIDMPEDTTPYTSYIGTEVFHNGLSVSNKSNVWKECTSSSAASTDLIPVKSTDSVWLQYVFFLSEAHAVGGFYDKEGNLVAPLYYKDFGFSLGGGGGEAAFRTPNTINRISIAAIEAATGKEIAFVRFTAWQASAGGHANTEARIYHTYSAVITVPTCTEKGYTTYACACGDSYVSDCVDATGHTYENGVCVVCGQDEPFETMFMQYDDHLDISGKNVGIINTEGNSVVEQEGNYLVATGIGTAKVKIDGVLYEITVDKAKINIVTIMGQSNAGNHFANATSDVTCPIGTAYWWGNGLGTKATEPVDYTQPSMGFHTPLLAELYAQSAAAGDPVKNVLIWQEGITSKNGQSIVKWVASETNTSGTDDTAAMIKNCVDYYEQRSDKYEIVNCGVYWLQGEGDVTMAPEKYTKLYMAMWNKLKEAGAEYVAFFRLRKGTTYNTAEHEDLDYTGSLTAQLDMVNKNPDMFMATTITENWTGTETTEHSIDIRNYFTLMEKYGKEDELNDSYGNAATFKDGILTTTMKTLYGSNNKCHYGKFGYGILGADAAYHMYQALHSEEFAIVQTDTSGKAEAVRIGKPGDRITIDITEMTENLALRASCGSAAGTLEIKVTSGNEDITSKVIATGIDSFGTIDIELLREYEAVAITVTYNPVSGTAGSVVYNIVDNSPEPPKMYFWDFENDLNARDEKGEIVNSFGETALNGSYVIENGTLKGNSLQLALEKELKLCGDENWSVEWKYGEVTENSTGFLLCNTAKSEIGTKTLYFTIAGKVMVSDYKNSKGYYNFFAEEATFASGDCIKLTNTYDSENKKSVLSLWKNGKLIVSDLQKKGFINSSTSGTYDMSAYPLSGDFVFNYLGCTGLPAFLVTGEIDYIKIIPEEERAEPLALRYDDHYDVTAKTVEIIDAGTPTSYQVGYGVEENAVLDTAVVTVDGDYLVATGVGTAKVRIDGVLYRVEVTAAPISLILLAGQSNMQGSEGNADQSIVCPDGMVYSTYGDRYTMTVSNATNFAPSALTGEGSTRNVNGTTANLKDWPVYLLNEAGAGKAGPDSGFAYEWVKQTGEKVWVVNAAHGGTSINVWQLGTTQYEECQALFTACQQTLQKEIAAGHYTLSHMGYFWCQGCSDRTQTAEWYVKKYLAVHEGFKTELAFDHDSNPETADKTFEFGGIIPVRVGSTAACYRDGTYSVSNPYAYHESFVDLRMNGPRVAQYWMINNPALPDIWGVCNIGEDWVWMPDGTNGVSNYFNAHYENGTVDYTPQVAQKASWYTPTTPKAVHDSIHYNQIGYNEIGRESVRNALIMLGEIEAPEVETTVEFLSWDGYTEVEQIVAADAGSSGTLVVPMVYPLWDAKEITYELSDGLTWNYYDLLAADPQTNGTLTSSTKTVNVIKAEPGSHFADHLSELPENVCCGLNLWNVLEHDKYYYASGTNWGIYSSGGVCSVTILVNPGDLVYATSFGAAGTNGHSSSNGIRTTFFSEYGVAKTMGPAEVYAEFCANEGYIVAPEGAVAINIAMWNNSDDNEIYILNLPHDTAGDICSFCGKDGHTHVWSGWETVAAPSITGPGEEKRTCSVCGEDEVREVTGIWQTTNIADHWNELPDHVCGDLNLWSVLEHDPKYYVVSKGDWGYHSSRDVPSVTIPVKPGDRIFATSFGAANANGHGSANGIRCTFFDINGVVKTMDPAQTYAEFVANGGYLIAPEGTVAVNIAMWNNSEDNEIYILNREHVYEHGICTGCGEDSVRAVRNGNALSLSGELSVGTKILVSCYNGERFAGSKVLVWNGSPLLEEIPAGESVKLLFVDENWLPLRAPVCVE